MVLDSKIFDLILEHDQGKTQATKLPSMNSMTQGLCLNSGEGRALKAWPSQSVKTGPESGLRSVSVLRNEPLTNALHLVTTRRSCRLATLTAAVQPGQRRRNMEPEIIILFVMFYLLLEEWEIQDSPLEPVGEEEEEERTLA